MFGTIYSLFVVYFIFILVSLGIKLLKSKYYKKGEKNMKSFKEIFESVKLENLEENVQQHIKEIFKNDKEFTKLKKAAKKNSDGVPDFLDYVYSVVGDGGMEKISKKFKMDYDKLAKEFLK